MVSGIENTQMMIHDVSTIAAVVLGIVVIVMLVKKLISYLKYKALERRLTKIVDDALRKCDEISMLHNDEVQNRDDSGKKK